ncbi:hypothetical protein [Veillonella sp.]|uniref:hypothetical protein n=1 Tax=Veillonella sp. TaxID=1926307 RepID=UPI0025F83829|nr:hypothetical protein [Veillonella sp.]
MNKLIKKRIFEAVDKHFKNNNNGIVRQEIISIIKINALVSRAIVHVITMNRKWYLLDLFLKKSGIIMNAKACICLKKMSVADEVELVIKNEMVGDDNVL